MKPRIRAVLLCVLAAGCGSTREKREAPRAEAPPAEVKITHFYSSPQVIAAGEKALLCYGVENAKKVEIEPAVEQLSPSLNRCFEVTPAKTTQYTISASGEGGHSAAATIDIKVSGARAAERTQASESGPAILYFRDEGQSREGEAVFHKLCFSTRGATKIRVDPGVVPTMSTPLGCFTALVAKTTTYTLSASDATGKTATEQLRIER